MKLMFCMAAAASGKSTFIKRFPTEAVTFSTAGAPSHVLEPMSSTSKEHFAGETLLLDGDHLIGALTGWPTMSDWHKTDVRDTINFINVHAMLEMCSRLQRKYPKVIVLVNAAIGAFPSVLETYGGRYTFDKDEVTFALVEIPPEQHREYVENRIKDDLADPSKGKSYPGSWREANNNRDWLVGQRSSFLNDESFNWHDTIFTSFDEVLEAFDA